MQFTREIQRLLIGTIFAIVVIIFVAVYWAAISPNRVLQREDNPRLVEAEARIMRGAIYDRYGELLVETTQQTDGTVLRNYLHPELNSALGYYSLRYGAGRIEAAFDPLLRGGSQQRGLQSYVEQDLLHMPQRGTDIQLTLDLNLQQRLVESMAEYRGAAVLLTVPDGEVLAMVSIPTFDPNTLDAQWDNLINAPDNPFFNRVLQGTYQPGNLLQIILLTAAVLEQFPLDEAYVNAAAPVTIADTTLTCTTQPPSDLLTLTEAFIYGCPAPFAQLVDTMDDTEIRSVFELFRLASPITLLDFLEEPPVTQEITPEATSEVSSLLADALGQGRITMTPLHIAALAAAPINSGNALQPYTLAATRAPNSETWAAATVVNPTIPIVSQSTADLIHSLMVESAALIDPTLRDLRIGGKTALAFSGEETQVWFVGFAQTGTRSGYTIAIVLEDTADPLVAAEIGIETLRATIGQN